VRFLFVFALLFVLPYSLRCRERKKCSVRNTRALACSFGQPTAQLMSGLSLDSTVSRASRHSIDQSRVSILTRGNKHISLYVCNIVVTALHDDPAVTLSLSLLLVTVIRSLTPLLNVSAWHPRAFLKSHFQNTSHVEYLSYHLHCYSI